MRNIFDLVLDKINEYSTPSCIGLDPDIRFIPRMIKDEAMSRYGDTRKGVAYAFLEFNKAIIDATEDIVGIYKPQMAFYEKYGPEGIQAFIDTVVYLKNKDKVVIEDAKRNDVGNTATAYADSHLGKVKLFNAVEPIYYVDLITVNGYLGEDGVKPFISASVENEKGIFVLAKTSNPSSVDFQNIKCVTDGNTVENYMLMMDLIKRWADGTQGQYGYMVAGAVVGTTFPADAKKIRDRYPDCFFLVPGYGAQGGTAEDIVSCFNKNSEGALVSSSRQINYAYLKDEKYTEENFADAARDAALSMKNAIASVL